MSSYQKGFGAYERGNYDTALKEWRPLAKQGLSQAQYNLGLMYAEGEGVAQDYQEAVRWYRLAAEQGHASGQFSLGAMYIAGHGVPKDYVLAHMWMNMAAAKGVKKAGKGRDFLEILMTPAQLAEAQRLAREWKSKGC
ncbi:MAG: sel1 repeat family protein [Deltaproteobacteria bacterium]|nr:sel1 repeat family protein [Deltaproteobacteria bacterium]